MCKLHKTSNLRLVLQLLEITGLKHLWVWELEFKASCPTQKLPVDYLEDKVDYYIQLSEVDIYCEKIPKLRSSFS